MLLIKAEDRVFNLEALSYALRDGRHLMVGTINGEVLTFAGDTASKVEAAINSHVNANLTPGWKPPEPPPEEAPTPYTVPVREVAAPPHPGIGPNTVVIGGSPPAQLVPPSGPASPPAAATTAPAATPDPAAATAVPATAVPAATK